MGMRSSNARACNSQQIQNFQEPILAGLLRAIAPDAANAHQLNYGLIAEAHTGNGWHHLHVAGQAPPACACAAKAHPVTHMHPGVLLDYMHACRLAPEQDPLHREPVATVGQRKKGILKRANRQKARRPSRAQIWRTQSSAFAYCTGYPGLPCTCNSRSSSPEWGHEQTLLWQITWTAGESWMACGKDVHLHASHDNLQGHASRHRDHCCAACTGNLPVDQLMCNDEHSIS